MIPTIIDFETEMSATRRMLIEESGLPSLPPQILMRDATPPPDGVTQAFCESAGFTQIHYIDVDPAPTAQPDRSYENVCHHVNQHGGVPVLGWIVRGAPMLFYEAQFHTVWRRPDGALVDVTPRANESLTLFGLDGRTVAIPYDPRLWPKKRAKTYASNQAAADRPASVLLSKDQLESALDHFLALADRHDALFATMAEKGRIDPVNYPLVANEMVEAKVKIFLMVEALMMRSRAKKKDAHLREGPTAPTP